MQMEVEYQMTLFPEQTQVFVKQTLERLNCPLSRVSRFMRDTNRIGHTMVNAAEIGDFHGWLSSILVATIIALKINKNGSTLSENYMKSIESINSASKKLAFIVLALNELRFV